MNFEIPYTCFDKFVLRTPLFPYSFINSLFNSKNCSEEIIKELCKNKIVQEAIFLASPDLYNELLKWINGNTKEIKRSENLLYSLIQYLIRMSSRCTPFGLFAGFCVGELADKTNIVLEDVKKNTRHTRLDMNYLCALVQDLVKIPEIRNNIKFYPNSNMYKIADKYRYVEYKYQFARRSHHIVAVVNSEYLKNTFEVASKGSFLNDLSHSLVSAEISLEESDSFITELVNNQLLIPELEPAITGPEFLDQILNIIQDIENIEDKRLTTATI